MSPREIITDLLGLAGLAVIVAAAQCLPLILGDAPSPYTGSLK